MSPANWEAPVAIGVGALDDAPMTAAKPRHLAAVGLMSRCIVHDQSLAYDKEVS